VVDVVTSQQVVSSDARKGLGFVPDYQALTTVEATAATSPDLLRGGSFGLLPANTGVSRLLTLLANIPARSGFLSPRISSSCL
jgi:hypothetical protein